MKSIIIGLLILGSTIASAAPSPLVDEMQRELESAEENLALDQEDEQFLDDAEKKGQVVWGQALTPTEKPTVRQAKSADSAPAPEKR